MSQTIQSIIVEDEESNQKVLNTFLAKYCPKVNVLSVSNTYAKALKDINELKPELVFLDIKLDNNYTAFDLLLNLEFLDFYIVFITAYDEFTTKAINDTEAIYYITKPLKIADLEKAVHKVNQKLSSGRKANQDLDVISQHKALVNPLNKIMLPKNNAYEILDIDDIIRVQAFGNYVQVYSNQKQKYTVCKKLKFYENRLKEHNFLRVHRSHLINLSYVNNFKRVGKGGVIMMSDDSKVQMASNFKKSFLSNF